MNQRTLQKLTKALGKVNNEVKAINEIMERELRIKKADTEYIPVKDYAQKWGISANSVRTACREGKVASAKKLLNTWHLPAYLSPVTINPRYRWVVNNEQ